MKILKNKKGLNDISILAGVISIFILIGAFLPFINDEFDTDYSSADMDTLEGNVGDEVRNVGAINAFTVLLSVLKMFFWTFGDLPFWLDISVFMVLRIIFVITIARNIWPGGGG